MSGAVDPLDPEIVAVVQGGKPAGTGAPSSGKLVVGDVPGRTLEEREIQAHGAIEVLIAGLQVEQVSEHPVIVVVSVAN